MRRLRSVDRLGPDGTCRALGPPTLAYQAVQLSHIGRQRGVRVGEQGVHAPSVGYAAAEGQRLGPDEEESAPWQEGKAGSRRLESLVVLEAADVLDIDAVEDHL